MRFVRPSRSMLLVFLVALGLTACASGGGGGTDAPRRGSSTRITTEELQTVAQFDVFTAIGRLRPQWLRPGTRGALPNVVVNGAPQAGGVESLRSFQAGEVAELQFMNASDATNRFGTGYTNGAILVTIGR